jgi:hypothetical protein
MESSVGCHSIDVIGALCHVKEATGVGSGADVLFHGLKSAVNITFQVSVHTLFSSRSAGPKS